MGGEIEEFLGSSHSNHYFYIRGATSPFYIYVLNLIFFQFFFSALVP